MKGNTQAHNAEDMAQQSIEQKYKWQSVTDAVTGKDWVAGSASPEVYNEIIAGGNGEPVPITYAPAWSKIVDETIVNASDHVLRCIHENLQLVTEISVTMGEKITVRNTGSGIPVCVHAEATREMKLGRDVYICEFIFGQLFQGSNAVKPKVTPETLLQTLIGGTNGIGAKATNCFSKQFTVRTYDEVRQLYYEQTWTDGMKKCSPPIIRKYEEIPAKDRRPFTEVTYTPDYEGKFSTKMTNALMKQYCDIIYTRMIMTAMYVNYACGRLNVRPPVVTFNSKNLSKYKTTLDIAKELYPRNVRICGTMIPAEREKSHFTLPWEITVVVTPQGKQLNDIAIVNGMVTHGGGHINRARACIVAALTAAIKSSVNEITNAKALSIVDRETVLVMCCQIPNPGWTGQRKDVLKQTAAQFSHYEFAAPFAKKVGKALADSVLSDVVVDEANKVSAATTAKIIVPPEVYTPALRAGKKRPHWRNTSLCLCEGNSAVASAKRGGLSREWFGFLSLQGVIMNARRESTVEEFENEFRQHTVQSIRLQQNKGWNLLLSIVGLDANSTYADDDEPLHYGQLIMFVDQDHDGKGNILGLFMSMFGKLWPNLIRRGYIKWFATPIIRAFPTSGKGRVAAFYNEYEYAEWSKSKAAFAHNVRYFKGIGSHSATEATAMFKTMSEHLLTFVLDERSEVLFEVYFGNNSNKRKEALSRPMRMLSIAEQKHIDETLSISCSTHLETDVDWYQRDNLERKLDHVVDGQNQAGRKILNSLIRVINSKELLKVAQFAGDIARHEDYHHGEVSLENSIFNRGLFCVGAKQLPFVRPYGAYGTRACGGKQHCKARYGHLKANGPLLRALFPQDDYCMLQFNFVDGKRKEPKYFMPIVPLAVCESGRTPAHGWTLQLWARFLPDVVKAVRDMINRDDEKCTGELRPYAYQNIPNGYKGQVCTIGGEEYSFGTYEWHPTENQIIITELPLRVWTDNYVKYLQTRIGKGVIADVQNDDTDMSTVRIIVTLEPGTYATTKAAGNSICDGIIEYFKLRSKLTSHINLMTPDKSVAEFENYADVVSAWYPHRRDMYIMRAIRQVEVLKHKIVYYENIVRYIKSSNDNKFAGWRVDRMVGKLKTDGYVQINEKQVNNPGFTATGDLKEKVFGEGANYNYLIDLTDRKKSAESLQKYEEELEKLRKTLEATYASNRKGEFPGADMWLKELDELEFVYYDGVESGWTFGDESQLVYDS